MFKDKTLYEISAPFCTNITYTTNRYHNLIIHRAKGFQIDVLGLRMSSGPDPLPTSVEAWDTPHGNKLKLRSDTVLHFPLTK